ncbi:MAG: glycosyltransferase [Candidatus Latescibacterota bacterium]|nr:MAG: glycosyltransferase [Candidatus Latescibacterota bacterium]
MGSCGRIHNILILENELKMGGLEKKLYDLVKRIDRGHFRVVVCCLKQGGYFKDAFVDLRVPFYEGLLKHKYDVLAYPRLLRLLRRENIDLVYTLPHPNSVLLSAVARFTGRVRRVVVSIHGTGSPSGGKMVRGYLKPVLGGVDRFIAVAQAHRRYLIESESLDARRVVVIYNGVDVEKYRPGEPNPSLQSSLGIKNGERVITTVSSLNRYKGIDVLLRAASPVCREFDDIRFVIVGGGPERDALETLSAELGLTDRVIFTGIRTDVDDILRLSDLFVLPSRTEAFPNVVLEAMASGLPVVSTDVGSVAELVEEGKSGLRVPSENVDELCGAIRSLLVDATKAKSFGKRGRAIVEDNFRLEGMCHERERLFEELLCR